MNFVRYCESSIQSFENVKSVSMKRKSTFSAIGGYQPFLFCIGMYFVALFFSIFICSAIFYAINPKKSIAKTENMNEKTAMIGTAKPVLLSVAK